MEAAMTNDRPLPAAHNPRSGPSPGIAVVGSAGVAAIFLPFTQDISPLRVVAKTRSAVWRIAASTLLAVTVLAAGDAAGQTPPAESRLFAGGALAGNWVHTDWGTWIDPQPGTWNSNGRLAVGVSIGARISERWSVQVEAELPTGDATRRSESTPYPGASFWQETRYRTPTVAVLFGIRPRPGGRVDVGFQFGPGHGWKQSTTRWGFSDARGQTTTGQTDDAQSGIALSLGVEVAIRLTSRVSVVPQLRVHDVLAGFPLDGGWSIVRPAVGVRVRF
jgi:hypothetical protein